MLFILRIVTNTEFDTTTNLYGPYTDVNEMLDIAKKFEGIDSKELYIEELYAKL